MNFRRKRRPPIMVECKLCGSQFRKLAPLSKFCPSCRRDDRYRAERRRAAREGMRRLRQRRRSA